MHHLTETVHRIVAAALIRAGKSGVFPLDELAENYDAVRDNVATMLMLEGRARTRDEALAQMPQPTEWDLADIGVILMANMADLERMEQGDGAAAISRGTLKYSKAVVCHHYDHPRAMSDNAPICGKCGAPIART